jgi:putative integral membrane protein (TIGR02587 family)
MAAATAQRADEDASWGSELLDLVRGASGGLLFGVPLLYTMEVWWTGSHTDPHQALLVLGLLAIPVLALNLTAGFRSTRDTRVADAFADTVEAVALGLVVSFGVLVLLQEIQTDTPVDVAVGKVVYECVPFCLGVGVARHFLRGGRAGPDPAEDGANSEPSESSEAAGDDGQGLSPTAADLGAAALGAVFVSLSIAPTDEVPMIKAAMSPAWLLVLMAASLAASYAIVFVAGFSRQDERHEQAGAFQHPITETIVAYLVALLCAGLLLWLFQRGLTPWRDYLGRVVVLGFPAAIGGAAGRLAV